MMMLRRITHGSRCLMTCLAIGYGALAMHPVQAVAGTCLEGVHGMAKTYGLAVDPPNVGAGPVKPRPTPKEKLGSPGVVEPPPTESHGVTEPPKGTDQRLTNLPDVPAVPPNQPPKKSTVLSPSDRVTLQSTLMAARAEAKQGREAACYHQLQKAQRFLARKVK